MRQNAEPSLIFLCIEKKARSHIEAVARRPNIKDKTLDFSEYRPESHTTLHKSIHKRDSVRHSFRQHTQGQIELLIKLAPMWVVAVVSAACLLAFSARASAESSVASSDPETRHMLEWLSASISTCATPPRIHNQNHATWGFSSSDQADQFFDSLTRLKSVVLVCSKDDLRSLVKSAGVSNKKATAKLVDDFMSLRSSVNASDLSQVLQWASSLLNGTDAMLGRRLLMHGVLSLTGLETSVSDIGLNADIVHTVKEESSSGDQVQAKLARFLLRNATCEALVLADVGAVAAPASHELVAEDWRYEFDLDRVFDRYKQAYDLVMATNLRHLLDLELLLRINCLVLGQDLEEEEDGAPCSGLRAVEVVVVEEGTGTAHKVAAASSVHDRLVMMEEVVQMAGEAGVDGLQLAAYVGTEFVRIHPFVDGNGRVARLLQARVLAAYGIPVVSGVSEGAAEDNYQAGLDEYVANATLVGVEQSLRREAAVQVCKEARMCKGDQT